MFYSKKSQITLIIILGMIILFAFSLLFFLKKPGEQKEADSPSKLLYELESGLVKDHITACLFKTASDGVERIGNNGGVIYDFEGGTIPLLSRNEGKDYLNYTLGARTFFVAYGLRENSYCPLVTYSSPDYPLAGTNLTELPLIFMNDDACGFAYPASDYDGFFGQVTMPKLCPFLGDSACKVFGKGEVPGLTIQRQIEDYIVRKLPLCVDLSNFSEQFNADISLDGNISAKVSIQNSNIQILVKYPFKITFSDAEPISKVVEYQSVLKVRFGSLYNFVYDILSRDAREPFFNLKEQSHASSSWLQGFELRKVENPCSDCSLPFKYDDVVEVLDDQSVLNGKTFKFRVAMQERRPALALISDESRNRDISSPDFNSDLNISIVAVDPDDTDLRYYFLGEGAVPGWQENSWIMDTQSVFDFRMEGLFLILHLDHPDYGNHPVSILVLDEAGLFDYQLFHINVEHTGYSSLWSQSCEAECKDDAAARFSDCARWCWISQNPCLSVCSGNYYDPPNPGCDACAGQVYFADQPEQHILCQGLTEQACIVNKPDCFWVKEPLSNTSNLAGSCYSDHDLSSLSQPAFISLSTN